MTAEERQAEFRRLYASIPGKNIEKLRRVCDVLKCKPITIRVYLLRTKPRTIPELKLKVLREALAAA